MTIDAHIHLYPPSVYGNPREWAETHQEKYWLNCVAPESGPTLQAWASIDQLLADMDDADIEKAVILGWYWENADSCEENIAWQQNWIAQHPDRLIAFAPFNAKGGLKSIDSLKRAFDRGFSGIGEINPPAQGYSYESEFLDTALEIAAKSSKPVNLHVTDPSTRDYPGKIETPFDRIYDLARHHSNTTFVFAHLAGMMHLPKLAELGNVYLDTAAVPLLYSKDIYHTAISQFGADRILFGTDYPLRAFPKSQVSPDFTHHIDSLKNSGLSSSDLDKIFNANAGRLLCKD